MGASTEEPNPTPTLAPQLGAGQSDLAYTVLRPTWFSSVDEVDYEITRKGEPEKGSVVSQASVASCIVKIIKSPESYVRASLGINKPDS